jgi:hypothetical protein
VPALADGNGVSGGVVAGRVIGAAGRRGQTAQREQNERSGFENMS